MNPTPDRPDHSIPSLHDDELGALVRSVASDWRMPPQRLDQPTWRDRLNSPAGNRQGALTRVIRPGVAALLATVAVAFVAVWLTAARHSPAAIGGTPQASAPGSPAASPYPKLLQYGALPTPSRILVRSDAGYEIADLSTGSLAPASIASYTGPTSVIGRPGGGWACICSNWIEQGSSPPTGVGVNLEAIDGSGTRTAMHPIRTLMGSPDPKWAGVYQMELADVATTFSADGMTAFVGWSVKHGAAGWTAGIDLIDVASGAVTATIDLPIQDPPIAADWPNTRIAPRVSLAPSGDRVLISSFWYMEDPTTATPPSGTEHWTAAFDGQSIGRLSRADATSTGSCVEVQSGLIDASTWYELCTAPNGVVVARNGIDGAALDRTTAGSLASGLDGGTLVTRSGNGLFMWDPVAATLTRFDLGTAAVISKTFRDQVGGASPVDALSALGRRLGSWLAPTVSAKTFLEPAIAVSPDGSRVYALGVDQLVGGEPGGSRGVYVFDGTSLQPISHWTANADYNSLAVSPDGRFAYAAGQAGRDAAGAPAPTGASITAYATADGSVRLVAGQLGQGVLWFPGPVAQ